MITKHDMPAVGALEELSRFNHPAHQNGRKIVCNLTGDTILKANKHGDISRVELQSWMGF